VMVLGSLRCGKISPDSSEVTYTKKERLRKERKPLSIK
jgi:hypothetical protein